MICNARKLTKSQLNQLARRMNMLNKRIYENPNKEMGWDRAELSALQTLLQYYFETEKHFNTLESVEFIKNQK